MKGIPEVSQISSVNGTVSQLVLKLFWLRESKSRSNVIMLKNTLQALKHPSADAVTINVHKSDTTASNKLCQ